MEFGYMHATAYIARKQASQLACEGAIVGQNTAMLSNTLVNTGPGQLIEQQIAYAVKEYIQLAPQQTSRDTAKFLFNSWDKGTFPNRMQSIRYHFQKHGNNRTYKEYTQEALEFFDINKNQASKVTLKNGESGYSIKLTGAKGKSGGFWTEEGKIITFWD